MSGLDFTAFLKKIFIRVRWMGWVWLPAPFSLFTGEAAARVWHHCSTLKTSCSDAAILHTPLGLSRQTMSISGWIGGRVPQFLTCSPLPLSLPRISLGNLSIRTVTPLWAGTSPATLCCIYVLSPAQEGLWRFACATSQPLENPLNLLSKSNLSLIMTLSSFQKCSSNVCPGDMIRERVTLKDTWIEIYVSNCFSTCLPFFLQWSLRMHLLHLSDHQNYTYGSLLIYLDTTKGVTKMADCF